MRMFNNIFQQCCKSLPLWHLCNLYIYHNLLSSHVSISETWKTISECVW